jgi:hypothetical protein
MRLFSTAILTVAGAAGLAVTGCAHHYHERETVYVQQPAQPVYVQPAPAPGYVVVPAPPPPVIVEPRPLPPSRSYIWVDGYWHWDGGRYAWHRGYWTAPPRGYSRWVPPHYEPHGREYHYTPGHWDHDRR